MSFDALQDKIRAMKNPAALRLDARQEDVPEHIRQAAFAEHGVGLKGAAEAVFQFHAELIDALCDIVPAVVIQPACYERFGWQGMEALERVIQYARSVGMFTIVDGMWGGGVTACAAYAQGWLSGAEIRGRRFQAFDADCVTLNGYMGSDALRPFLEAALAEEKCVFTLVKTANPSAGELQDMVAGDRLVYQVMGDLNERLAKGSEGKYGYTIAGAVVGTDYPSDLRALRKRLPHSFFLVTGCGGEGTAEDIQYAFDPYGRGAVIASHRDVMCAWKKSGDEHNFAQAARKAAVSMRDEIKQVVTVL